MSGMFDNSSVVVCLALLFIAIYYYLSEDGNHSLRGFFSSSTFRDIIVEVLSVVLATTLAISCALQSDKQADADYTVALLSQERLAIDEQRYLDEAFLKLYEDGEMTLGELCANLKCDSSQIEYLLQNDTVVSCISPTTYLYFSDAKGVLDSCSKSIQQQENNPEVYLAVTKTAHKWLVMTTKMIDKEIEYQKGTYTAEDVRVYEQSLIHENFELGEVLFEIQDTSLSHFSEYSDTTDTILGTKAELLVTGSSPSQPRHEPFQRPASRQ